MKKRSEARLSKSLLVDISRNGLQQMGVTVNISRRGMCIATTNLLRRRSRLRILVAAADNIYAVTGMVVWNIRKEMPFGENVPVGLGVRIMDAAPGYFKYLASIKRNHPPFAGSRPAC